MNTLQIESCLSKFSIFGGVYSSDCLPTFIPKRPIVIISNVDSSSEPGSHWVAIYISKNDVSYFFDSYGLYPVKIEFVNFLQKHSFNNWNFNKKRLQDIYTDVCGMYVCIFTLFVHNAINVNFFEQLFSNDTVKNDALVCDLFKRYIKCPKRSSMGQSCRAFFS